MRRWMSDKNLRYSTPTPKLICFGAGVMIIAIVISLIQLMLNRLFDDAQTRINISHLTCKLLVASAFIFFVAIIELNLRSDKRNVFYLVRRSLCDIRYSNPLHLKDGNIEPNINVECTDRGFRIQVECKSAKMQDLTNLESVISNCLIKKYKNYAVVVKNEDLAGNYVEYYIEDVVSEYNKQSVYHTIDDVPTNATKIYIRDDICIDYSKVLNASTIVSGKSRSGKTTGIISTFLLPILKLGRDDFGSIITIVDPKSAELSMCPYVLCPDEKGEVNHILDAIREFNILRVKRQKYINEACKKSGKVQKWYELGMKPCILFLDEYISLQELFPKKASKENPDYSLQDFQGLLRQISTQGASAGCFLVLSTAEASVGTGGLESAVNNACGIRILFKPSKDEARYLWDSSKFEVLRDRRYVAGDAWFSSDDGINNDIRFVKFPKIHFGEYQALADLLTAYFGSDGCNNSSEAKNCCTVPEPNH